MEARPEIVHELRALFKEGATPSRLIRHIVERHAEERDWQALIQEYFLEAFGVPLVRGLGPADDYRHTDLRYAFLNEQLLHEMIDRRSAWDGRNGFVSSQAGHWFDTLSVSDDQRRLEQLRTAVPPELNRCWPQLTAKEQYFIQRSMASANGLYETVKILSRLAECLQQRVDELEKAAAASTENQRGQAVISNRS